MLFSLFYLYLDAGDSIKSAVSVYIKRCLHNKQTQVVDPQHIHIQWSRVRKRLCLVSSCYGNSSILMVLSVNIKTASMHIRMKPALEDMERSEERKHTRNLLKHMRLSATSVACLIEWIFLSGTLFLTCYFLLQDFPVFSIIFYCNTLQTGQWRTPGTPHSSQ